MPEDSRPLVVAPGTVQLYQYAIDISRHSGESVSVGYQALPGCQPKTYRNIVYAWRGSVVPWPADPWRHSPVTENLERGVVHFDEITVERTPHVFGYAVSDHPWTVCASVQLDLVGAVSGRDSVGIGVQGLGTDSVDVCYHVLSGYLPARVGNWIGLWKGRITPYWCPEPLGRAMPPDVTDGVVTVSNVPLAADSAYTLVYFMSDVDRCCDNTTAAALLTFRTTAG